MIFQSCYPVELEGKDGPDIRSSVVVNPDTILEKNVDQVSCTIKLGKIDCNYLINFHTSQDSTIFSTRKNLVIQEKSPLFISRQD